MYAVSVEFDMNSDGFDLDAVFDAENHVREHGWADEFDAGSGFGFRDLTFYCKDEATAWNIIEFMRIVGCCNDRIYEVED
jgi:hypothetical protein